MPARTKRRAKFDFGGHRLFGGWTVPGRLFDAPLLRSAERWAVGLLALLSVGYIGVHLWGRWRAVPACCADCGYGLTGNESGTCPECGNATRNAR